MTTLDIDALNLESGSHHKRERGVCLLEAVAWYAGEDHSDMPACVSPVLRRYGIRLNDGLPNDRRQELKQFIPALVGTASDGRDGARAALARRVLMIEWLPQWLRLAGLDDLAAQTEQGAALPQDELRRSLSAIRNLAWAARLESRSRLMEQVKAELAKRPAAAAAAVAADAAAAAYAAAYVAVAVAVAVDADVDADVAADVVAAAAVAVAADVAAAVAADVAVAAAAADPWGETYAVVYKRMRAHYEASPALADVRALRDQQLDQAIDLYRRMIEVQA